MINKHAVKTFLERELDEFDWVKDLKVEDLDAALAAMDPVPEFHTEPHLHQKACFLLGVHNPEFLFFLDMGLGKTKLILDLISYEIQCGRPAHTLVVVPNLVNIETWVEEAAIHTPNLVVMPLYGSTEQRMDAFLYPGDLIETEPDVWVINYKGLMLLGSEKVKNPKTGKSKSRPSPQAIKDIGRRVQWIVFDESTEIKNHASQRTKVCTAIGRQCSGRFALTGTPHGRDPSDLWSQFMAVDQGATLGTTLGLFREAFFAKTKSPFGHWYDYRFKEAAKPTLHRLLKNRSIWYDSDECVDLPDRTVSTVHVKLPEASQDYYRSMMSKLIEAAKVSAGSVDFRASFVRLRQITSGFLGYKDDESGAKVEVDLGENPKLEALLSLIDQMPLGAKMIVFNEFIHSGEVISSALDDLKIWHTRLWSGTMDKKEAIATFKSAPGCRVLISNHKSGGKGLNLQAANYVVFYESPLSPIDRSQAEKRAWRPGQGQHVFQYDLVVRGSVDQQILENLEQGKNLLDQLVKGKELPYAL